MQVHSDTMFELDIFQVPARIYIARYTILQTQGAGALSILP